MDLHLESALPNVSIVDWVESVRLTTASGIESSHLAKVGMILDYFPESVSSTVTEIYPAESNLPISLHVRVSEKEENCSG